MMRARRRTNQGGGSLERSAPSSRSRPSRRRRGASCRAWVATSALLLALLIVPSRASAGAWTEPAGGAYARITAARIDTRERFDSDGRRVAFGAGSPAGEDASYRARELRVYGEYGARKGATLFGSIGYKLLESGAPGVRSETDGVSDLLLGARLRLQSVPAPVCLSVEVKIPTGYDASKEPVLGSGQVDVAARVLAGYALGRAYATADAGFRMRAGGFRDELLYSGEVGSRLPGPLYARLVLRGEHALGAAELAQGATFDPGLASPRRMTLDGVAGIELGGGVSLEGGASRVLSGRGALAGTTLELGIVMRLEGAGR